MGGGKGGGGSSNTVVQQSGPPAWLSNELQQVYGQAQNVASQPLNQGGFNASNLVAGFTPDQNSAFNTIDNLQGVAQPYINSAQNYITNSTQPIWSQVQQFSPNAVQQYMSPYTSNVLNSTIASENNQDAIQQAGVQGNAISSGAWGGDRSAVAQGIVAGQQALANNATNAGILQSGYNTGLQEFNTEQQQQLGATEAGNYLNAQGAFAEGNLGNEALSTGLSGANAQLQSGALQQELSQEQLNVPYEQFLQQQAYPFQTTGWLSSIADGTAGAAGGTSSTTSPGSSSLSQILGTGLGVAGLTGGFGSNGWLYSNGSSGSGLLNGLFSGGTDTAAAESAGEDAGLADLGDLSFFANRGGTIPHKKRGGLVPRYDDGGGIVGGTAPSSFTMNPQQQSAQQNYSGMSLQQLRQLATRVPPESQQGQALAKIIQQKQFMPNVGSQVQGGLAGGMSRGGIPHFDDGGITPSDAVQAMTGYTLPDGTPDNQEHDYKTTSETLAPLVYNAQMQQATNNAPSAGIAPPAPSDGGIAPNPAPARTRAAPDYQPDINQAIAAAGFGIAAGTSPHALTNIGAGALKGLNEYQEQKKEAAQQTYQEGSLDQQAQKLAAETEQRKSELAEEHLKNQQQHEFQMSSLKEWKLDPNTGLLINSNTGEIKNPYSAGKAGSGATPSAPPTDANGNPSTTPDDYFAQMSPTQIMDYRNTVKKNQPKDLQSQQVLLTSLVDQNQKVNDLVNQIPVASSGDLHKLQDFADRNKIPIFSDPQRGAATVAAAYDTLGNVLDNVKSTFGGTGRVLQAEFSTLKNELNAASNLSPEQKAIVVSRIQSRLNDITKDQLQYTQDVSSGMAYMPSNIYKSPMQKRLESMATNPTPGAATGPSAGAPQINAAPKVDANGNKDFRSLWGGQ